MNAPLPPGIRELLTRTQLLPMQGGINQLDPDGLTADDIDAARQLQAIAENLNKYAAAAEQIVARRPMLGLDPRWLGTIRGNVGFMWHALETIAGRAGR